MELNRIKTNNPGLGDKRQYFPYELKWKCPECGLKQVHNFAEYNYLSYPEWGGVEEVPLFCDDCQPLDPTIFVEVVPDLRLSLNDSNSEVDHA